MNVNSSLRYYVYGLGFQDGSIFHIGVTDQNPEAKKLGLSYSLPGNESLYPQQHISQSNSELDAFAIEDFPTLDAAQEAASFWLSYFQSLGLKATKPMN